MAHSVHTSSLSLSLLRHSSLPSQSFVFSPFTFTSSLSILHDGANGRTQEELTNLLLGDSSPSEVTDFYSTLALSLSSNKDTGVLVKCANRFYVDDSISLKRDYQRNIGDKYKVEVKNIKLSCKVNAAREMNTFVEEATSGKIKDVIKTEEIITGALGYIINAAYIFGLWKHEFKVNDTYDSTFHGYNDDIEDENFNFFYLMPNENSNLEKMRNEMNGAKFMDILKGVEDTRCSIIVPKFKIESEVDGEEVLGKMGVRSIFSDGANLSKISSSTLKVNKIKHSVRIETNELGTEAAAATIVECLLGCSRVPLIHINRPFLFGILRNDHILFIGQFTGN